MALNVGGATNRPPAFEGLLTNPLGEFESCDETRGLGGTETRDGPKGDHRCGGQIDEPAKPRENGAREDTGITRPASRPEHQGEQLDV